MKKSALLLLMAGLCLFGMNSCKEEEPSEFRIILKPSASVGKDVSIHSIGSPTVADNEYMWAAGWTSNAQADLIRMLFEFNLTMVSKSAVVVSAQLSLYGKDSSPSQNSTMSGSNACWIERITEDWSEEEVSWLNQPATTDENRVEIPESTTADEDYELDVTALVQDMVNNPSEGYGFMVKLQTEQAYRMMAFATSDNADENLRPRLIVQFIQ
ncbi:DNRLRE domain-containing protein [Mangrovibacterium lignilyticum]|uniref:DNRLRE domain-containing protein n=1 Tax=Mangrovibacterium lignilyticum TaxID=2668052 RepID=UPI0013D67388|nr:DNRLRE domain-containing protein [Mangrovibacterium lignilyticum]